MTTLATLTAHAPSYTREASFNPYTSHTHGNANPLLSAFLPSLPGPLTTVVEAVNRVCTRSWLPRLLSSALGGSTKEKGSGGWRKDEELKGKAIKVVDLLQHSVELGHSDALYVLAKISLVRSISFHPRFITNVSCE